MGRAVEIVLLAGGSLCLALGLTWPGQAWTGPGLIGAGIGAIIGGIGLSVGRAAKAAKGHVGSLGVAAVDFSARGGPKVTGPGYGVRVRAHADGTISLRVRGHRRAELLACRAEGACYFNTLSRSGRELRIKLVAPYPPMVRLELFDSATGSN